MRLEARGVSKTFGSTTVLRETALVVSPGEIHALIGQNGSGKSTLVKILTGYHTPDPGASISVDGRAVSLPVRWDEISAAGISVVHQDLGLVDHLSVSENIGIGGYLHSKLTRKINWKAQAQVAARILARLGVDLDPTVPVGSLNAMRRAEVAIARALRDHEPGQGLVILDEATRALPREELHRFHELLRRVVAEGTSVLMVSHNLDEVLHLADRVTILRDGKLAAGALPTQGLTEADLARHMLGKNVDAVIRENRGGCSPDVAASVIGLTADGLPEVSFEVHRGEIVGLTGLPGSGFESIPQMITGGRNPRGGTLHTPKGVLDLTRASVATCMRHGVALVPEKRIFEGLALELSIRDNIAIPNMRQRGKPWLVKRGWQEQESRGAIDRLSIRTKGPQMLIKELSGGNQQKVLFAKWLSVGPDLLVLHEPTQAVDVGARVDILRTVTETAARGVGVLLVSIEPADLAETCDRILVFGAGSTLRELRTTDPDTILDAVYSESAMVQGGHA